MAPRNTPNPRKPTTKPKDRPKSKPLAGHTKATDAWLGQYDAETVRRVENQAIREGRTLKSLMTIDATRRSEGIGAYAGLAGSEAKPGAATMFTKGVSGATGEFITEKGQSKYAAGEAEGGATKSKKRKQRKKLIKRVVKKTNVKGKRVRRALKSPGVTAGDKKVYRKVAKQATPKLSSRLRAADRRKGK